MNSSGEFSVDHYTAPFGDELFEIQKFQEAVVRHPSFNQFYHDNYSPFSKNSILNLAESVLKKGGITVLRHNARLVALSSYYFWNDFTIGGVRFLNSPEVSYAAYPQSRSTIPLQIEAARNQGSQAFCICINLSNLKMMRLWSHTRHKYNEKTGLSSSRKESLRLMTQFIEYPKPVRFNFCEQKIFYIPLSAGFRETSLDVFNEASSFI